VLQLPSEEKYLLTLPELEDQISVMLGGRASEEIISDGIVSTGASNDLERASAMARQIVTRYGMSSQLGLMTYGTSHSNRPLQTPGMESWDRNYSERTAELIDSEARQIIDRIYKRVREILKVRRNELQKVAQEIIERETLTHEELGVLLESAPESSIAAASN
jgi:cell division protease FtsH